MHWFCQKKGHNSLTALIFLILGPTFFYGDIISYSYPLKKNNFILKIIKILTSVKGYYRHKYGGSL